MRALRAEQCDVHGTKQSVSRDAGLTNDKWTRFVRVLGEIQSEKHDSHYFRLCNLIGHTKVSMVLRVFNQEHWWLWWFSMCIEQSTATLFIGVYGIPSRVCSPFNLQIFSHVG